MKTVLGFVCLTMVGQPLDLLKDLEQAEKMEHAQARKVLREVVEHLRKAREQPASDREEIRRQLAKIIPRHVQTQKEVLEIVGPESARTVSRQVLFRRYLEQWTFDAPLRLVFVFDCPLGQQPRLQRVIVLAPK